MTEQHPIKPPTELVLHWSRFQGDMHYESLWFRIANEAAQWGYDQRGEVNESKLQQARDEELEACCEWLLGETEQSCINALRDARRPKPPSLKEQALEEVGAFEGMGTCNIDIIRRALERLQDLEEDN